MSGRCRRRIGAPVLRIAAGIGIALAAASTPADPRGDVAGIDAQAQQAVPQAEGAKICKRVVPTGSRIARRYCLPKSQWDAMEEDGQRAAREARIMESQYGYDPVPGDS